MRPTFDDNDSMFIYTTTSEDGGRTWSPARKESVWGYPTSPLRMPSGKTLLTYGYRRPDWAYAPSWRTRSVQTSTQPMSWWCAVTAAGATWATPRPGC